MKPTTLTLWLASALVGAHVSFAQPAPENPSAQPRAPASETIAVSDAELDTFATIYVDLLGTMAKYKGELQSAKTDEETRAIEARMQEESIAKVAQRGWSPEKFDGVTEAINKDPRLAEKAVKLIEEKS